MPRNSNLIVMLTYNDQTVKNAYDIFEQCKSCTAQYWGLKEKGLPPEEMKKLCAYMKECGKTTVLEVVAYTESECMNGAKAAVDCGCDILMGTLFHDSVNTYCKEHNLKYMPFVGDVQNRPSTLDGSIDSMIEEATDYLKKGVYGIDLLAYRYKNNAEELIEKFVSQVDAPVCIAGSINSLARLDFVKASNAWAFTVGSAFFDNKFDGSFSEQINKVSGHVANN